MKLMLTTIVLLISTILLSACAAAAAPVYTKSDQGSPITVSVGDTFSVKLEGNPTTGYAWEALPDAAGLLSQVGEPDYDSSDEALLGSGGMYTFTFKAEKAGETTLEIIYHRSFETGVDPIDSFKVTIIVE
jgi:inhibitor of cysteine peptidase